MYNSDFNLIKFYLITVHLHIIANIVYYNVKTLIYYYNLIHNVLILKYVYFVDNELAAFFRTFIYNMYKMLLSLRILSYRKGKQKRLFHQHFPFFHAVITCWWITCSRQRRQIMAAGCRCDGTLSANKWQVLNTPHEH